MKKNWKRIMAFTLAEIMIAFTIIAVISVSTIGVQKSKSNYVDKFMYYAAFQNVQDVVSAMISRGMDTTTSITKNTTQTVKGTPVSVNHTKTVQVASTVSVNHKKSTYDAFTSRVSVNHPITTTVSVNHPITTTVTVNHPITTTTTTSVNHPTLVNEPVSVNHPILVYVGDDAGACGSGYTFVPNAAESAFNSWKSAWNAMRATPKLCVAGTNDCTNAHAANDAAAAYYNSLSGSPDLSTCTSQYYTHTSCGALTYGGAKGSCQPNQLKGYYLNSAVTAVYDAWVGLADTCGWDGNKSACLASPLVTVYNNAINNSTNGSPCTTKITKFPFYPFPSDNPYAYDSVSNTHHPTQGIGWCMYQNPAVDASATTLTNMPTSTVTSTETTGTFPMANIPQLLQIWKMRTDLYNNCVSNCTPRYTAAVTAANNYLAALDATYVAPTTHTLKSGDVTTTITTEAIPNKVPQLSWDETYADKIDNPNFALVKQYYDAWCDTGDATQFNLYKNTVEHSNTAQCDKIPYYSNTPYHHYDINTEGEGYCANGGDVVGQVYALVTTTTVTTDHWVSAGDYMLQDNFVMEDNWVTKDNWTTVTTSTTVDNLVDETTVTDNYVDEPLTVDHYQDEDVTTYAWVVKDNWEDETVYTDTPVTYSTMEDTYTTTVNPPTTTNSTKHTKALADTGAEVCTSLVEMMNISGAANCAQKGTVTPNFTTSNGMRWFNFGEVHTNGADLSTQIYTIYVDIDGASKGANAQGSDILPFLINRDGTIVLPDPGSIGANNTKYLSSTIRYKSGTTYVLPLQGITYREAVCKSGTIPPVLIAAPYNYCNGIAADATSTTCATNNCEVVINKPGI